FVARSEIGRVSSPGTRVVIVDDHPIVRDALACLLGESPELQIVGVTASIRETLPLVERTMPDLLLVDLSLEDGSGIELARALRRTRTKTRVLIITGFRDEFAAAEALSVGVHGYILKEQPTADLLVAIDTVARGGRYISPLMASRMRTDTSHGSEDRLLARLSRREREIFRLVVAGSGSKEIASRLFISVKTVDTHRTNINRKLGVRTTASLIRFAAAHGIAIAPRASSEDTDLLEPAAPPPVIPTV
ncbi:MAG TPA: response regulator transcription factor, partial [Polyangia bacterium]|nr:response regulator transcription factor [Polyangia bacterium]